MRHTAHGSSLLGEKGWRQLHKRPVKTGLSLRPPVQNGTPSSRGLVPTWQCMWSPVMDVPLGSRSLLWACYGSFPVGSRCSRGQVGAFQGVLGGPGMWVLG